MTNLLLALVPDRLDKIAQVTEEILLQLIHRFIDSQLQNDTAPTNHYEHQCSDPR